MHFAKNCWIVKTHAPQGFVQNFCEKLPLIKTDFVPSKTGKCRFLQSCNFSVAILRTVCLLNLLCTTNCSSCWLAKDIIFQQELDKIRRKSNSQPENFYCVKIKLHKASDFESLIYHDSDFQLHSLSVFLGFEKIGLQKSRFFSLYNKNSTMSHFFGSFCKKHNSFVKTRLKQINYWVNNLTTYRSLRQTFHRMSD